MIRCEECLKFTEIPHYARYQCKYCLSNKYKLYYCTYSEKHIIIDFEANQESGKHK